MEVLNAGFAHATERHRDRRAADRFPIARELRYRVLDGRETVEVGCGETINMSSSGILFTTEHEIGPGRRLEVSVSWPAQLDDRCALKLVAKGRIVRSEPGKAAMAIEKYEFRTRGSNNLPL